MFINAMVGMLIKWHGHYWPWKNLPYTSRRHRCGRLFAQNEAYETKGKEDLPPPFAHIKIGWPNHKETFS